MSTTLSTPFVASSIFKAKCHPLTDQVVPEVERYFTSNWQFKTEEAKRKFLSQGLIRLACLYNALAVDDRIALACKLTTILFFSDGQLVHTSNQDIRNADICRCA